MPAESVSAPATRKKRNPGRNLPMAFLTGGIFGGIALFVLVGVPHLTDNLMVQRLCWTAIVAVLVFLGLRELIARLQEHDYHLSPLLLHVAAQAVLWTGALMEAWFGALTLVVSFFFIALLRLFSGGREGKPTGWVRDTTMSVFLLVWLPVMASYAVRLWDIRDPAGLVAPSFVVLTCIAVVVCSDTGGYTFGVLWGQHPLVPNISPKKSWEGLAGSLIFASACAIPMVMLVLHQPWWLGIIVAVVLTFTDIMGDLFESQFKRELGIKDMSNLLPGHGGIMDRVDGMLPSFFAMYYIMTLAVMS